jgi:hypothetical protein
MPWKNVSTTLGKENYGAKTRQIGEYLKELKRPEVLNVSIQNENAKISLDTNVFFWKPRQLEVVMTTRLEGERLEKFYEQVPDFLRRTEDCDLDLSVARPLGSRGEEQMSFAVGIIPGYASNKQAIRSQGSKTFVAEAYYPEGYSGRGLDGYYVSRMSEDTFTRYLRLAAEAEKLGFVKEVIRPEPGKCMSLVCINPWEMVEQEFVDFTKSMMQKKETQNLTLISTVTREGERGTRERLYDFRATVLPKSNNVELAVLGWKYQDDVAKMFGKSLDLFGVELSGDDKVSYKEFYETEHKGRETLKNVGSKIGRGIATPFILAGRGIIGAKDAVGDKWGEYKDNKQRKIDELKQEIRTYGIQPNEDRIGSCYVAMDQACLLRSIGKKKTEKTQKS